METQRNWKLSVIKTDIRYDTVWRYSQRTTYMVICNGGASHVEHITK